LKAKEKLVARNVFKIRMEVDGVIENGIEIDREIHID
jgi:hypothetical protein